MATQIIRNENNEITTGNLCVFNGKTKRKMYCISDSYQWLTLRPLGGVDIHDFMDSLRLTINGVEETLNVHDQETGWVAGSTIELYEERVKLEVEYSTLFTICSTYDFTYEVTPM